MRVPVGDVRAGILAVRVPRDSAPGEVCEVRCVSGAWKGTCPDFEYRRRECKHILRVKRRLAELQAAEMRAADPEG